MITIAIDGASGAGKSTLSDALAQRLGILHIDTGAMYRAVGLCALRKGIEPSDENAVVKLIENGDCIVDVKHENNQQVTLLNGQDVNHRLRDEKVGLAASTVSRYKQVRRYLVKCQQEIARQIPLVMDGRDIGTVVLPDAKAKIFLEASPEVRAYRRCKQIGIDPGSPQGKEVLTRLIARDEQDTKREVDPLKKAEDAVLINTDHLTFEETLNLILQIVEDTYGKQ
ncbi:MAG TPA: (d)CMP kinase [Clostridiales bacterium]|jgi:cytidylate kinase|nr:(d)CMP kinase [Clostridiales bacterium]